MNAPPLLSSTARFADRNAAALKLLLVGFLIVLLLVPLSMVKSTLAERLAQELDTVYVAEYGRLLWEQKGGVLHFDDMLHIADRQIRLEDTAAGNAREFLICDTSPLTTMLYSEHLFGRVDPRLEDLAMPRRYDLTLLCAPDFPFVQDGTRQDDAFRRYQHGWYLDRLAMRGDPWMLAHGSIDERVRAVKGHLHPAHASAKADTTPDY
jgi:nicotinamide riboside kinase